MYYIIIPITAGDTPESWYAYLLKVGPIPIFQNKPEITDQHLLLRFFLNDRAVHYFDDPQVFSKKDMRLNFSYITEEKIRFELCENPNELAMVRLNTNYLMHNAWRLRFNYQDQSLTIGRKSYFLLCSGLFKSPPVSVSRNPENREIVYYNEDSQTLNDCYQGLCTRGLKQDQTELYHNLECVLRFVRNVFERNNPDIIATILADQRNVKVEFEGPNPRTAIAVNLKRFINDGAGFCRHHAMLVCYLLKRLQADGCLPEGEIIHYRMTLPNKIGHTFVLFRTTNHYEISVIDSAMNGVYRLPTMHPLFTERYGLEIYTEIQSKYLEEEVRELTLPLSLPSRSNSKL